MASQVEMAATPARQEDDHQDDPKKDSPISPGTPSVPAVESCCCREATCADWLWWALVGWGGLFAMYIVLVFFAQPFLAQPSHTWGTVSDYSETYHAILMGMHWAGGIIILLAGPLQFVKCIRHNYPAVHRWTGRAYLAACAVTAVPGLVYTIAFSTRGGIVMDISFVGYGLAMLGCACMTGWHAWHREIESHRAWATRLYAVGIGSAVYRLLIAPVFFFYLPDRDFEIWINVAAWLFYLPSLALAEAFIRGWCPACCGGGIEPAGGKESSHGVAGDAGELGVAGGAQVGTTGSGVALAGSGVRAAGTSRETTGSGADVDPLEAEQV